jgi:Carbohydrate-selective porin, OprB family/S-layer homology domain
MTSKFWNVLKLSPVVFAAIFFAGNSAFAAEKVTSVPELSQEANSVGQVNSVAQYKDVQPSDWAYQALQSLTERYGCISGYPDGTFRGQRTLTRYEFAAALNLCLDRVNELIATSTSGLATQEDLGILQNLQEDFSAELATLRGRVDKVEAKTAELESKQFSTTTKLSGEAIFNISGVEGKKAQNLAPSPTRPTQSDVQDSLTFSDRIRIILNSSFDGKDQLQIRLNANNTVNNSGVSGTQQTRLSFDGATNPENSVVIDKINYAFDLTKDIRVKVDANNGEFYGNVNNYNPSFASDGKGSISRYGRFSPIYRLGQGGAGATITYAPKKSPLSLSAGYLANKANDPTVNNGLDNGSFGAIAQVGYKFSDAFSLGATYGRSYQSNIDNSTVTTNPVKGNLTNGTGSSFASNPFSTPNTTTLTNSNTTGKVGADYYGLEATIKPSKNLILSGWYGTANAETLNYTNKETADLNFWGASLAVQDFGKKGNVLGLIVGQPPKVTGGTKTGGIFTNKDTESSLHVEGLYRINVNKNLDITPGLLVIYNAENQKNDPVYVGTVRTTFSF